MKKVTYRVFKNPKESIEIEKGVIYRLSKQSAKVGQISGVDVGHTVEGLAGWMDNGCFIISSNSSYIRTSPVVKAREHKDGGWLFYTQNKSIYLLEKVGGKSEQV